MPEPRNHNHIIYNEVRVPLDHLLGPEDGAKVLAQRRLGGGRIHHAMRTIAQCKLAFDMMCERALSRESHGKTIAEHQMVQEKIADSYASIRMLRLFVLETAWKIDNSSTQEARTDIAAVKYTMARVLREVSFNALHILGSLGTTNLTPLQDMYAAAPHDGNRRRRRRGPQGHRRPQRAEVVPAARGQLADRVLPGQAGGGAQEVRAAARGRIPSCATSPTATRSTWRRATDRGPSQRDGSEAAGQEGSRAFAALVVVRELRRRELRDAGRDEFVEPIGARRLVADDRQILRAGEAFVVEHRPVRRQLAVDHEHAGRHRPGRRRRRR